MIKIDNLIQLMGHKDDMPEAVYNDVNKRLCDWLESEGDVKIHQWVKGGGEINGDLYIRRQFDYAASFVNKEIL